MNGKMESGFTLLELLTVVSLLAVTAVIASGTFVGAGRQANDGLVHVEMQNIVKAIRQFKQDTGYYPKTGPFAFGGTGSVTAAELPADAGTTVAEQTAWFYSPANFYQLISDAPLLPAAHPLFQWNAETGRGWRGPYINGHLDGFLTIGSGINGASTAGNFAAGNIGGNPTLGAAISSVRGIADPFEYQAVNVGGTGMLGWITPAGQPRRVFGRPYMVFNWDNWDGRPVLVGMGPDGVYNTVDDIELYVE